MPKEFLGSPVKTKEYIYPEKSKSGKTYWYKQPTKIIPMPAGMEEWFKETYPGKNWFDITTNERETAKKAFKNRNTPYNLTKKDAIKLEEYLLKQKTSGNRILGTPDEINKAAGTKLKRPFIQKYIRNNYPNTFIYPLINASDYPQDIKEKIWKLGKTKANNEIYDELVKSGELADIRSATNKPNYKTLNLILQEGKRKGKIKTIITKPTGSNLSAAEQKVRDSYVKNFIKSNPDITNPFQIAKGVSNLHNIKMSRNYVLSAGKRLNLDKEFSSLHKNIFPDIKKLDKLIKDNAAFLQDPNVGVREKKEFFTNELAKATGKNKVDVAESLVTRLRKLGNLYAGDEGSLRYEKNLYKTIKSPKNYLNSNLHKSFIELTDSAGQISNSGMARLLGLPKKDIDLIDQTASMMRVFKFDVAGDHTDIKALMKNFPNYRKNFTRIEYIKDSLNQFKAPYDQKMLAVYRAAKQGAKTFNDVPIQEAIQNIQKEFADATGGYRIGGFEVSGKRITIDPQTPRLGDLDSPLNESLQRAMQNFESYSGDVKPSYFKNAFDRLFLSTKSLKDRINLLKNNQGSSILKGSKVLEAFNAIPRFRPITKALIAGTAGAAAINTMASANEPTQNEMESGQMTSQELYDKEKQTPVQAELEAMKAEANVKPFDEYNPETYPSNEEQKSALEKYQNYIMAAGAAAGVPYVPEGYRTARELGRGRIRSAVGLTGGLGKILTATGTPGVVVPFEVLRAADKIRKGASASEILMPRLDEEEKEAFIEGGALDKLSAGTKPLLESPYLSLAFAEPFAKTTGIITKAGEATPGILSKVLRLGLNPRTIAGISRFAGLPGLALSAGLTAYDLYQAYQDRKEKNGSE